ncbi:MAG: aminopeptidase, partial [Oscillospiraceae bacterium]|nr:aminopeptidase [Oscillospiraceae bacterium]
IVEAGALIESGLHNRCERIILVTAPREVAAARIMARDGLTRQQADARLDAQRTGEQLQQLADYTVVNDGDMQHLHAEAENIIHMLNEWFGREGNNTMAEEKKTAGQQLEEQLFAKKEDAFKGFAAKYAEQLEPYCNGYMEFLNSAKTEREFAKKAAELLEANGFKPFEAGRAYTAGERVYWLNCKKSLIAAVIGKQPLEAGMNITAAHIDSPRLDLKPNPLYEDCGLAYFKTHYYGGVKKYQWSALPLALHGTVVLRDGTEVDVSIGEDANDPIFYITDLLPHLARKVQGSRTMGEVLTGEELNILLGSEPYADEKVKEPVKLNVLRVLNEKYGMVESDFISAEFEMVPALKSKYVGFDKSLIAAYAHDDRVCSYTALTALLDVTEPEKTCLCILADKEEVGSMGNTGLNSDMLRNFTAMLCRGVGAAPELVFLHSKCLSADVNAAFDPTFPSVHERMNAAFLNYGPVISKYTGSGGKGGSNDASAEFMGAVRRVLDAAEIPWQVAELGKVDEGGGGTVAQYVSHLGIDTVDVGVALLSMHAPYEIAASWDVFATMKAMHAFYVNM